MIVELELKTTKPRETLTSKGAKIIKLREVLTSKEIKAEEPREVLMSKGTRIRSKSKWTQAKAKSKQITLPRGGGKN